MVVLISFGIALYSSAMTSIINTTLNTSSKDYFARGYTPYDYSYDYNYDYNYDYDYDDYPYLKDWYEDNYNQYYDGYASSMLVGAIAGAICSICNWIFCSIYCLYSIYSYVY